jgi:phage tail-like protein
VKTRLRAYRFGTADQWQRCLMDGFDVSPTGGLQPIARLGTTAQPFTTAGPVTRVCADRFGGPIWRLEAGGTVSLVRRDEHERQSRPFEVDTTLARCPRWALGRDWLWAFDADAPIARRYERDSADEELVIDLRELTFPRDTLDLTGSLRIQDLASDAREGAWLLVEGANTAQWLLHVDCRPCPDGLYPPPKTCALHRPAQLGMVARGARLVLLTRDDRLVLIDAGDGTVLRTVSNWKDNPCWHVERMTTDGANRIVLLCGMRDCATRWAVFVLDAEGDVLDMVAGPQDKLTLTPNDAAIADGVLWLAADDGLWQLDSSDSSISRESDSVLITPVLQSPQAGTGGGWLRAEISVDLPRGAVIEAEAVTTRDAGVVRQAAEIAGDTSRTLADRQQALWDHFDHSTTRVFHLTAATAGNSVALPLIETNPWLCLRLKLVTPPGVAPPAISELRVLYPDATIAQQLPAVFRGDENDPTGFLRLLVGVLETTTQGLDERIRSIGSQVDPTTAPAAWLDYVAGWLDLPWEAALPVDVKRRMVSNAGALLEQRGTRRGLELLLGALAGPKARVRVIDVTVDHAPMRLGGTGCADGAHLPMLVTGAPRKTPILGSRARLGVVCLGPGVPCDPLRTIVPTLRIGIAAPRGASSGLSALVERVVMQYVPAGIRVAIRWTTIAPWLAPEADDIEVLDANSPGRLGDDSEIGRIVLSGRGAHRVDGAGLDLGFRLA